MTYPLIAGAGVGSMPFGSAPYGSAVPPAFTLTTLLAKTANSVEVTLDTGGLEVGNRVELGSPLNPLNWTLLLLDPGGEERLVQHVELLSLSGTTATVEVFADGVLSEGLDYRLSLTLSATIATGFDTGDFTAVIVPDAAKQQDSRDDDGFLRDIANPALKRDTINVGVAAVGTYQISDTGDLAQDSGLAGLRKRIIRRLTTSIAGFFHLGDDYGTKSNQDVKKKLTPDLVERLRARARAQCLQEPEVRDVTIIVGRLSSAPEVLSLIARVRTQSDDQPFTASAPLGSP